MPLGLSPPLTGPTLTRGAGLTLAKGAEKHRVIVGVWCASRAGPTGASSLIVSAATGTTACYPSNGAQSGSSVQVALVALWWLWVSFGVGWVGENARKAER